MGAAALLMLYASTLFPDKPPPKRPSRRRLASVAARHRALPQRPGGVHPAAATAAAATAAATPAVARHPETRAPPRVAAAAWTRRKASTARSRRR